MARLFPLVEGKVKDNIVFRLVSEASDFSRPESGWFGLIGAFCYLHYLVLLAACLQFFHKCAGVFHQ